MIPEDNLLREEVGWMAEGGSNGWSNEKENWRVLSGHRGGKGLNIEKYMHRHLHRVYKNLHICSHIHGLQYHIYAFL